MGLEFRRMPAAAPKFSGAGYSPTHNVIFTRPELLKNRRGLFFLAHELGHAVDHEKMSAREKVMSTWAYQSFNTCVERQIDVSDRIRDLVVECEVRASDIALEILDTLEIKLRRADVKRWREFNENSYRELARPIEFT